MLTSVFLQAERQSRNSSNDEPRVAMTKMWSQIANDSFTPSSCYVEREKMTKAIFNQVLTLSEIENRPCLLLLHCTPGRGSILSVHGVHMFHQITKNGITEKFLDSLSRLEITYERRKKREFLILVLNHLWSIRRFANLWSMRLYG